MKQSLDFSCGAAALATLLNRFHGNQVTERELLALLTDPPPVLRLPQGWRESGMSFATLSALARHYGVTAAGVELSVRDLGRLRVPAIAHLANGDPPHFTVITGIDPRGAIELADPAWGNRRMQVARFRALWVNGNTDRGRLMLLHPEDPNAMMPNLSLRRFYPHVHTSHGAPR